MKAERGVEMRKKYRKLRAAAVLLGMLYSLSFDWQICCIAADDSTWISLDNDDHWTHAAEAHACGKKYRAFSYDLSVEGYADRTLCCKWDSDPEDNIYGTSYLGVSRTFYSYSIIDRQGSPVFEEPDELLLSYSIDIGSIENKSQEANWKISTFIQCSCRKQENAASDLFGSSVLCNIEICDCSEGYSFAEGSTGSGSPVDLGTITADGVVYDVLLMNDDNSRISQMKVMRREKLAP